MIHVTAGTNNVRANPRVELKRGRYGETRGPSPRRLAIFGNNLLSGPSRIRHRTCRDPPGMQNGTPRCWTDTRKVFTTEQLTEDQRPSQRCLPARCEHVFAIPANRNHIQTRHFPRRALQTAVYQALTRRDLVLPLHWRRTASTPLSLSGASRRTCSRNFAEFAVLSMPLGVYQDTLLRPNRRRPYAMLPLPNRACRR